MPAPQLIAWLAERASIADLALEETPIERIIAGIYRNGLRDGLTPTPRGRDIL